MANKRIYYAIQQVSLGTGAVAVHGLQSVGVSTNFSLEQVFELGQLEIYQNIEEIPEVEVTLNKVLDGYPLIYSLATEQGASGIANSTASSATLAGRQNARCDVFLGVFSDLNESATGAADQTLSCPGMYVSSVSYTFPVDGNFTEDVTLVGNSKLWSAGGLAGAFTGNNDSPAANSVGRRQFLDIDACIFPKEIPGVSDQGKLTDNSGSGDGFSAHFQNITVSCDLGREAINELGRFAPYHRYLTFPVEVSSEFEVLSTEGDGITATEEGYYSDGTGQCANRYNLVDNAIRVVTCEGTTIDLGTKNKLTSINYSGGDTGGGNVTVTYSYVTYNDFTVGHTAGVQQA
jgi:hypothetical protein